MSGRTASLSARQHKSCAGGVKSLDYEQLTCAFAQAAPLAADAGRCIVPKPQMPTSVYVHFPWCLQKCPYCDFASASIRRPDVPQRAYTEAVLRELQLRTRD